MQLTSTFLASSRVPLVQTAKAFVAIAISWFLSDLFFGTKLPVFAAIAALLIVAPSVTQSFSKGIERSLGVILGVVLATAMTAVFGVHSWLVLVMIALCLIISWAARFSVGMTNQVVISGMIAVAMGAGTIEFATLRVLETALGSVVAFGVNMLLVPPVRVEPARERIAILGGEIAASLVRLADAIEHRQTNGELEGLMLEARLLRPMVTAAQKSLTEARESLTMNPWAGRYREQLNDMDALVDERLRGIVVEVIGMTRAYLDHYDDELCHEPMVADIADQCRRAAHDVRLAVHLAEVDTSPMTSAIPALTKPLSLARPSGERWILIGSLTEDLRRIHHTLTEAL